MKLREMIEVHRRAIKLRCGDIGDIYVDMIVMASVKWALLKVGEMDRYNEVGMELIGGRVYDKIKTMEGHTLFKV